MATTCSADSPSDAREILQLLLNAPQLTPYYHFDERPERSPLKVVNAAAIDLGNPTLTAAGRKVEISDVRDNKAFEITHFVMSQDSAEVSFTFRVEGIAGKASFSRNQGSWRLETINVAER